MLATDTWGCSLKCPF